MFTKCKYSLEYSETEKCFCFCCFLTLSCIVLFVVVILDWSAIVVLLILLLKFKDDSLIFASTDNMLVGHIAYGLWLIYARNLWRWFSSCLQVTAGTEDTITASLGDYECLTVTRNHQMMNNAEVVMKTDPRSSMVTGSQRWLVSLTVVDFWPQIELISKWFVRN